MDNFLLMELAMAMRATGYVQGSMHDLELVEGRIAGKVEEYVSDRGGMVEDVTLTLQRMVDMAELGLEFFDHEGDE